MQGKQKKKRPMAASAPPMEGRLPGSTAQAMPSAGTDNQPPRIGRGSPAAKVIDEKSIREANELLERYKRGKANLDERVVTNEEWYKQRHWENFAGKETKAADPEPRSGWLLNCLMNKHADAMDNYPEATVLPREASDQEAAQMLTSVLPCLLEQSGYEQIYSDMWWYKLKSGTGVQGVFWNSAKENGMGNVDIKKIDLLNLFWEPGITDIQFSPNLFHCELIDNKQLAEMYPETKDKNIGHAVDVAKYRYDESIDTSEKTMVVDWYYKKIKDGMTVLHYVKFAGDMVLFATENDAEYRETGWYTHGKYPFVMDTLFPVEGSPAGFGYVDIMKDAQMYIDKTDAIILKNGAIAAKKRWFVREDGAINEAEYSDWSKNFVHVAGTLDDSSIREISISPLDGAIMSIKQSKIEELKEIAGNRDVNQGGTSGATAASAIAAMQEAGSKLSRDMIKSSYRAYKIVCELVIAVISQFYEEPRFFRIVGEGGKAEFTTIDKNMMGGGPMGSAFGEDLGSRKPIYDLNIKTHKASPYSREAQNQMALQFYSAGFFNPQMADQALACIDMMDFEGKDQLMGKIQQNGTLFQQVQQLMATVQKLAAIVDAQNGTSVMAEVGGMAQGDPAGQPSVQEAPRSRTQTNSLGGVQKENTRVNRARQQAASASDPNA